MFVAFTYSAPCISLPYAIRKQFTRITNIIDRLKNVNCAVKVRTHAQIAQTHEIDNISTI